MHRIGTAVNDGEDKPGDRFTTHNEPHSHEQEYLAMQKSPPPFIWAVPEEKNILDCE
jgi:hypothetical protein